MLNNRIIFTKPNMADYSIADLGQNWFHEFLLSNFDGLNLTQGEHKIEVNTCLYNQEMNESELDSESFQGQLVFNHVYALPYSRLIKSDRIDFGYEGIDIVMQDKDRDSICNLGVLIFKTNGDNKFYKNHIIFVAQDSNNLKDMTVRVANVASEENQEMIEAFANFDLDVLPLDVVLEYLVYPDRTDLNAEQKQQLALDDLLKRHLGLDKRFSFGGVGTGVTFTEDLIDRSKQIYQKVLGSVYYIVFGNYIRIEFDLPEAPQDPKDLQHKMHSIHVEKFTDTALNIDQDYLHSCIPSVFEQVKKHYLVNDRYYSKMVA